jgi:uroporphyrinogen decarboxylase
VPPARARSLYLFAAPSARLNVTRGAGEGSKAYNKAKRWLYCHPVESRALLQRLTDVTVEYLVGQVEAGAQLLEVFESHAGDLSPDAFREFSFPVSLTQHPAQLGPAMTTDPRECAAVLAADRGSRQGRSS